MYTTHDADQEKKIACKQIKSSGNACARIGLTPQILRICKSIHQEAAPILYSMNLFQFKPGKSLLSSKPNMLRQERLEYLRRKLYQDPAELWGVNDHESLICSPFAVFLRQIGQRNAASLKRLKFVGGINGRGIDPMGQQAGAGIEVFTQLLKYHVPGARQVKICRGPDQWDEFEDGIFEVEDGILEVEDGILEVEHMLEDEAVSPALWDILEDEAVSPALWYMCTGCVPSLHLARPDEQIVMCRAIEELVEKVTWLKRLSVTGFGHDSPVSRKIEELEAIVKARR